MRLFFFTLSLCALLLAGCGSKHYWSASPTQGSGVRVDPMQTWTGGGKLWVRVTVFNGTGAPLRVVRDAVGCTLPSGQRLGRATGTTTMHGAYVLAPGESHAVYVEFEAEGFDWKDVPSASVDFSRAIFSGEQAVQVAPLEVHNQQ